MVAVSLSPPACGLALYVVTAKSMPASALRKVETTLSRSASLSLPAARSVPALLAMAVTVACAASTFWLKWRAPARRGRCTASTKASTSAK